jgi:hypothetical protein
MALIAKIHVLLTGRAAQKNSDVSEPKLNLSLDRFKREELAVPTSTLLVAGWSLHWWQFR